MKKVVLFLLLIVCTFIMTSCNNQRHWQASLDVADSMVDERPDSALTILDSLERHSGDFTKPTEMRWRLLRLKAQNKCDTVFRSDSLQLLLTEYYDKHGAPNERMTAHYLLGRAYSDMGEAPEAIRAYQKAVECADTTAQDCDLRTLCAILGQEAAIFDIQQMPREQIDALQQYSHFAKKDGRVYDYVRGHELQLTAWYALDDTARCFQLTEDCHRMYLENGMEQAAASVYPTAILILLRDSQYTRAKTLMQAFEGKSGLFDSKGNIAPGREHYYNSKGKYYNGTNQLDSAEYFYRKLAKYEYAHNYNAYLGIMEVYRKRGVIDSISKYSMLAERALDSIHTESQADALALAVSSFNYARKEELAKEKTMEAATVWKVLFVTIVLLMSASFVACLLYMKRKKERREKQQELSNLESAYLKALKRCEKTEGELETLKMDSNKAIKEKEEEREAHCNEIREYQERINKLTKEDRESMLMGSNIVNKFKEVVDNRMNFFHPNDDAWKELEQIIRQCLPLFTKKVMDGCLLGDQEQKVCILTRLGLHNGDIALLLDTSPQRVSNAKMKANLKLFDKQSASNLSDNLKD